MLRKNRKITRHESSDSLQIFLLGLNLRPSLKARKSAIDFQLNLAAK